jgi:hypothetical protein
MISVEPGWKTRTGFSADLRVKMTYQWASARPAVRDYFLAQKGLPPVEQAALQQLQACVVATLPDALVDSRKDPFIPVGDASPASPFNGHQFSPYVYRGPDTEPVVAAVSPMGDAQSLDIQASSRRARDVALQIAVGLAYAGAAGQAGTFLNYASRQQKDLETRNTSVVVSPYSTLGGRFGFRINPRIAASVDDEASSVLDVPSFPALLIVGADAEDLRPRVLIKSPLAADRPPRCFVVEPQLRMWHGTRWIPASEPCLSRLPVAEECRGEVLTERERFGLARELRSTIWTPMTAIYEDAGGSTYDDRVLAGLAITEAEFLDTEVNGDHATLFLPGELIAPSTAKLPKPTADSIAPVAVRLERDSQGNAVPQEVQMLIAGADLDQVDLNTVSAPIGDIDWLDDKGATATPPSAKLVGKAVQLHFRVKSFNPVVFRFAVKGTTTTIQSRPLVVERAKDLSIETRTAMNIDAGTVLHTVTFSPGVSDHVLKSEIEKGKPCCEPNKANVTVDVKATDQKSTGK